MIFLVGVLVALLAVSIGLRWYKKKHAQKSDELSILQAQQKALIDSIDDLAWLKDVESRFILVNRKFGDVFGVDPDTLVGKTDFDLSPPELAEHYQRDDREVMRSRTVSRQEERIARENGEIGWSETIKVPVLDHNGNVVGSAGVARDISERRQAQEKLELLAQSDALTGLGNRVYLARQFDLFLQRYQRFAVLFLDLDNFKLINDTDGHGVGDQLLASLADRLRASLIPDSVLVRLGGDEFLVMLPGITDKEQVEAIAKELARTVARPYVIAGNTYAISTSTGIVTYPEHGSDRLTLIKHADLAMYQAKKSGRNRMHWFSDDLASHTIARRNIEMRLREALENDRFLLFYQPVFDLHSKHIVGAEALLRLADAPHEEISPSLFVPIAEESALIIPVGDWVLRTAIKQLRQWNDEGRELVLAVNISGLQFQQIDFADELASLLAEFNVPAHQLELELTEGVLMENIQSNLATLNRIKVMGVRLAIDDFGTGYSSLAYLKHLPIDRLKIDRSFVTGLPEHSGDVAITRSIINIAAAFDLRVTAEGVEQAKQQDFLQTLGCHHAQGFLYSHALPIQEFDELLSASVRHLKK